MKKNIAIVITRLDMGGAQKVALYIAENLDKSKYNVYFITGTGGYLDDYAKQIKGIELLFMKELKHPISPLNDMAAFFKLKGYFIKNKIDIVHTHSSKAGILGRLAAKTAGIKKIIHTIHGFSFHEYQNIFTHFLYLTLEKITGGITDKLVAVGNDVVEYGLRKGVADKSKYAVIRAGIDINKTQNAARSTRSYLGNYGLKQGIYTVGMIGNLKKQKNPEAFVKIAKQVLNLDKNFQFAFAGDGPLKEKVCAMVKQYGIEDKTKFTGWIEEPEKFLKAVDIFLLTSLWEGLPCTIPQAIAAGKPCVVSNIAGNRELIRDGKTGFLYEPFDYKEAAEKIISLKNNPKESKKIAKAAFAEIKTEYDLKYMLKQYEIIYKNL